MLSLIRSASASAPTVVIDTNRVLDLWLFDEPKVAQLKHAIETGALRWLATAAMREELARVLTYPVIVAQRVRRSRSAAQVLAAFDRWAQLVAPALAAPVRCRDADDQMFIDLAVAWRARLFSKDREIIALTRPLAALGVAMLAGDAMDDADSYQK